MEPSKHWTRTTVAFWLDTCRGITEGTTREVYHLIRVVTEHSRRYFGDMKVCTSCSTIRMHRSYLLIQTIEI